MQTNRIVCSLWNRPEVQCMSIQPRDKLWHWKHLNHCNGNNYCGKENILWTLVLSMPLVTVIYSVWKQRWRLQLIFIFFLSNCSLQSSRPTWLFSFALKKSRVHMALTSQKLSLSKPINTFPLEYGKEGCNLMGCKWGIFQCVQSTIKLVGIAQHNAGYRNNPHLAKSTQMYHISYPTSRGALLHVTTSATKATKLKNKSSKNKSTNKANIVHSARVEHQQSSPHEHFTRVIKPFPFLVGL